MLKPDINYTFEFHHNLTLKIKNFLSENTVIVCIGTDKCIGDCLGPLVGSILTENFFPLPVYGTLSAPIHALNIDERLDEIRVKTSKCLHNWN